MKFKTFNYEDKKVGIFTVTRQITQRNTKKVVKCYIDYYDNKFKHVDKEFLDNIINHLAWELDVDCAFLLFSFEASFSMGAINEVSSEYLKINLDHEDWSRSTQATIRFSDHNCFNNDYNFNWSFDKKYGEALNTKNLEILIEDMKEESDS